MILDCRSGNATPEFKGMKMMSKKSKKIEIAEPDDYKLALHGLQIELVKFQKHLIKNNLRILIIFEGRDASGKPEAPGAVNIVRNCLRKASGSPS